LLDEYIGLPIDDARRYRHVITSQLADPLGIPPTSVLGPDVDDPDLDGAARRYEQTLEAIGGVDLQICGIGRNGHLAFNEPGARFDSVTRVVTLSESTRRDNARFFLDVNEVPERAITQGMSTIGMAHCVVLIATGPSKAAALAATLEGPITPEVPASVLRLHDDVIVVADAPALSSLQRIPRVMESST
jgi:glucosamine-6-phosphate deaminase